MFRLGPEVERIGRPVDHAAGAARPAGQLTPGDIMDARIDVFAQYALRRMSARGAESHADAVGMLLAVKSGQLAGIYKEDERVPAIRARDLGLGWWQLIPRSEDAALVLDAANPVVAPPIIVFRDSIRSTPTRLDPALRKAWRAFLGVLNGNLIRCDLLGPAGRGRAEAFASITVPIANIVPPILCAKPRTPLRLARLVIVSPPSNTRFAITAAPSMPNIRAEARILGVIPDPTPRTTFQWTVRIRFQASICPSGPNRVINPPDLVQRVTGGTFTPSFSSIRGGNLTFIVRARVGNRTLTARTRGLRIVGTNPPRADVQATLPNVTLRRIACQESRQRQFRAVSDGGTGRCPLFSSDGLGGVGIFQITVPRPTDDEVWNWRTNAATGIRIFNQKVAAARAYPGRVRATRGFRALVAAFNGRRRRRGLPSIAIGLPEFTTGDFDTNLRQLELDAIRGFNGFGGRDRFGLELHEFRVRVRPNGMLQVVNIDAARGTGQAVWERVPVAARPQRFGDPNYVNNVLAQDPACS